MAGLSRLRSLRSSTVICAVLDAATAGTGAALVALVLRRCGAREKIPLAAASLLAAVKIASMLVSGVAQGATALAVAGGAVNGDGAHVVDQEREDKDFRRLRKVRYKRWLWWTRFGMVITALQFLAALYLMCILAKDFSNGDDKRCFLGRDSDGGAWKRTLLICFLVLVWLIVIIQCLTGSDVLRWRSFYATHDTAWKAHYREVFDHGIREVLCCLGRVKYLNILEEDEIYSVATLLGDLVAYRASGTGHLELLAGLALLQKYKQSPSVPDNFVDAPEERLHEAAFFHQFAEAAYTGPLLDFGRNPILFPCAWLYRQGVLTSWSRHKRPFLEGDNWWRGHAAAFLKYVNLPPEALRQGRVSQKKCEAAYFVVVLHDVKSIVIAVRGTETPEDLITDGLCSGCTLSLDDLDGLVNSDHLPSHVKESVLSSFPHYGHSGIVKSARELFMKIDGQIELDHSASRTTGLLSSLLEPGCECYGYKVRIVGHSLGGAVAILLGLRLYARYPNLHVYAYGSLPCVDKIVADSCSDFVTSIIYNDEFSARLSVNSILRLRAAAIGALSNDSSTDSTAISKVLRKFLHAKKCDENGVNPFASASYQEGTHITENNSHISKRNHFKYTIKGGAFLCGHAASCMATNPSHHVCSRNMDLQNNHSDMTLEIEHTSEEKEKFARRCVEQNDELHLHENSTFKDLNSDFLKDDFSAYDNSDLKCDIYHSSETEVLDNNQASEFSEGILSTYDASIGKSSEMYVPGLIIHIVPVRVQKSSPLWKNWVVNDHDREYKAFVANRESFKDIVVSPYMFLDHLPWRCHYAMQRTLESRKHKGEVHDDLFNMV